MATLKQLKEIQKRLVEMKVVSDSKRINESSSKPTNTPVQRFSDWLVGTKLSSDGLEAKTDTARRINVDENIKPVNSNPVSVLNREEYFERIRKIMREDLQNRHNQVYK